MDVGQLCLQRYFLEIIKKSGLNGDGHIVDRKFLVDNADDMDNEEVGKTMRRDSLVL